mmetsp:Transcript_5450/g.11489  ORF Transcript_5450/g.11489 Transcript_5450/m.11489 type:complete len:269 (+) Transcript_5450:123-929(+)
MTKNRRCLRRRSKIESLVNRVRRIASFVAIFVLAGSTCTLAPGPAFSEAFASPWVCGHRSSRTTTTTTTTSYNSSELLLVSFLIPSLVVIRTNPTRSQPKRRNRAGYPTVCWHGPNQSVGRSVGRSTINQSLEREGPFVVPSHSVDRANPKRQQEQHRFRTLFGRRPRDAAVRSICLSVVSFSRNTGCSRCTPRPEKGALLPFFRFPGSAGAFPVPSRRSLPCSRNRLLLVVLPPRRSPAVPSLSPPPPPSDTAWSPPGGDCRGAKTA